MFSSYNDICIFKNNIKIGYIQSITVSHIRKNDYLNLPFPINFFGEEAERLEDRWERMIEAHCNRFVLSLKALDDRDRFSLLEDCGIDFRFGVRLSSGKVKYNEDGYISFKSKSKIIWEEEGFKFIRPISEFCVDDVIYALEFVSIVKDFSEPVDFLK